jgi:hypothetical protein
VPVPAVVDPLAPVLLPVLVPVLDPDVEPELVPAVELELELELALVLPPVPVVPMDEALVLPALVVVEAVPEPDVDDSPPLPVVEVKLPPPPQAARTKASQTAPPKPDRPALTSLPCIWHPVPRYEMVARCNASIAALLASFGAK